MKVLACSIIVAIAFGASACAGGHATSTQSSTDAIQLQASGYISLAPKLRNFVHSMIATEPDGKVSEIDVYGPGSRTALVTASSGDWTLESPREAKERFYLIVLHGQFVCDSCSGPAGAKPPHGTIETHVWSRQEGNTDFGISSSLPAAMSRLHRLATIRLS